MMRWTVQLEARTNRGEVETTELATLSRPAMGGTLAEIGLTLAEAKALLAGLHPRHAAGCAPATPRGLPGHPAGRRGCANAPPAAGFPLRVVARRNFQPLAASDRRVANTMAEDQARAAPPYFSST